jgi:hypothetical protein
MRIRITLCFALLLLIPSLGWTDVTAQQSSFEKGAQAYQKQDWQEALENFGAALQSEPENPTFLYNLGLSYYQLQKIGFAIAYWRKALYFSPEFAPAKAALQFALTRHPPKEIPHEIELWESLHHKALKGLSLHTLLGMNALLLLVAGWLGLLHWGRRNAAINNDLPSPSMPFATIFSLVILTLVSGLTLLKGIDLTISRGTITQDQVTVRTGPAEGSAELFDLFGGMEVVIRQTHKQWVQITYPGSYTGWVKDTDLLHTAGKQPW